MAPILNKNTRILTQAVLASSLLLVSSGAMADINIAAPTAGPVDMKTINLGAPDNVTIQIAGNVVSVGANNGVDANAAGKSVTIDANNHVGVNAIHTNTGDGILVTDNGVVITIGAGSGITVDGAGAVGINISAGGAGGTNATVNNSGTITTNDTNAILVAETGSTITNTATGVLTATNKAAQVVELNADFTSFTNAGNITSVGTGNAGAAIIVGAVAGAINNSGTISGFENNAVDIQGMTGTLTNTGTISSAEDAITVNAAAATGSIVNNAGGVISTTGTETNGATADGAIRLSHNINAITNAGTIQATSDGVLAANGAGAIVVELASTVAGDINNNASGIIKGIKGAGAKDDGAYAIYLKDTLTGSVINKGLITADQQHAIFLDTGTGVLDGDLTNTGTISVTDANSTKSAVFANDVASEITGTLNNSGTISVAKVAGTAIDFSTSKQAFKLTNSGIIKGDVLLSQDANTFNMTAGTLTGALTSSAVGAAANTFTITGGTITGIVTLSDKADTVNLKSATLNSALVGTAGAGQTLNITGDFTSTAPIQNIENINTQIAGTDFTVGAAITGVDTALIIDDKTSVVMNADVSGTGKVLVENSGTLAVNAGNTLTMTDPVNLIVNKGTLTNAGTITKNTIDIQAGKGTVTNSGLIDGINKEAITLTGNFTGDIINSAGGVITTTGTNAPGDSAIKLGANTLTGAITNAGSISVTDANGGPAILSGDTAVTKGITNTGEISVLGATAIDLSASTKSLAFTNSGTVTGDVKLSQAAVAADTTFTMTGGTIAGNVTAGGNAASTLNLNAGAITKNLTLSNQDDIVNVKTATISGNIVGNAAAQTLNVLDDFTTVGTIADVKTITVQNAGTVFDINGAITGLDTQLTVNAGTTFDASANVTGLGAVTNEGKFFVNPGTTTTMGGVFTNTAAAGGGIVGIDAGGTLNVGTFTQDVAGNTLGFAISDTTSYGKLIAGAGAFDLTGSKLQATLTGNGLVANGDVFTIIDSAGAGGVNGATFIQPDSQTVSFTPSILVNDLILTATRKSLATISGSGPTAGIAASLDGLFPGTGVFRQLFIEFDSLPSQSAINDALETLLPPTGGEINQGIADMLDHHQSYTIRHLEHLSRPNIVPQTPEIPTIGGVNNGDMFEGETGLWGYVFYDKGKQKNKDFTYGYDTDGMGLGFGWDRRIANDTIIGATFGYDQADYNSNNRLGDSQEQDAYTLSLYGEHDIVGKPMYIDGMLSMTYNSYKTRHHVAVGAATGENLGDFHAMYYDLYTRFNYDNQWRGYTLTPFVTFEFAHFSPDEYTETGFVPMIVRPKSTNVLEPGIGLRVWWENNLNDARYLPELYLSFQYDVQNEGLQTNATFAGTGAQSFLIDSAKPGALSFNLGFNLTAYNAQNWLFAVGYDFEGRTGFKGHTASLKLRYRWD
jgi:fibronectin-binding autotransporter adhesin